MSTPTTTDPSPTPAADFEQRKANRRAYFVGYKQAIKELELALSEGGRLSSVRFVLAHMRQHLRNEVAKWADSEVSESASTPPVLDITIIERSLELVNERKNGRRARRAYQKGKDLPREKHAPLDETILSVMLREED